jgi:IS605 OrfB family transposase
MKTRQIIHGEVWFRDEDMKIINKMVKDFSSSVRSAYQAIHKNQLKKNDIVKYVKKNYMSLLNQRYINDAVMMASMINQDHVIFGGKRNWKNFQTKTITKQEWLSCRNNQLYSRGDITKKGNPNIRIVDNKLWINEPTKRGKWIKGNLYLQKPVNLNCYDVRLLQKDNNKFFVIVSHEKIIDDIKFNDKNGVIGIDTNPDGIAIVETDYNGNLLSHQYIKKDRIQFAEEGKRNNDIRLLAKEVVGIAKYKNKPIIVEQLNFKQKKSYKKFNRMKSNFLYRKIIEAIRSRAIKEEVFVKEVHSAFTSILGQLKYQKMYSLNRHTSAGLVIGRRGMNIKEKQTFSVKEKTDKKEKSDKDKLNLEGRGLSIDMTRKAWSWMQDCFLHPKPVILTGSCLVPLKEAYNTSIGETPIDEPTITTGRCGINNINRDVEGHPCKIF